MSPTVGQDKKARMELMQLIQLKRESSSLEQAKTDGKDQTKQPQTTSSATSDPSNEKPKEEKTLSASVMASPTANPELATTDTPKEVTKETSRGFKSSRGPSSSEKKKFLMGLENHHQSQKKHVSNKPNQDHEQFLKELEKQSIQFKNCMTLICSLMDWL